MKHRHHIKYKEYDGTDEYFEVESVSEHNRLNKEAVKKRGFRIPKQISNRAHDRLRQKLYFSSILDKYAYLHESVEYYPSNGDICYSHWVTAGSFAGRKGTGGFSIPPHTLLNFPPVCETLPDEPILICLPWLEIKTVYTQSVIA